MAKDQKGTGWGFQPYTGATVQNPQEAYQKPASEKVYYYDKFGDFQYGARPDELYYDNSKGAMVEGVDPNLPAGNDPTGGSGLPGGGGGVGAIPPPAPPSDPFNPPGGGGGALPPSTRPDLPQPPGGPVQVGQQPPVDTSWNWDAFAPKRNGDNAWGGYDQDYQAFERYQPGQESPWGMPDVRGGNKEFYQQQFANLLRDDQGYRNRARTAQDAAQSAQDNPLDAPPTDWSWANGGQGLKDVTIGNGQTAPTSFSVNDTYAGQTNREVWDSMKSLDAFSNRDTNEYMDNWFAKNPGMADRFSFSNQGDPNSAMNAINPNTWEGMNRPGQIQDTLAQVMQNLYTPGQQGATAPVGYASPI